MEKEKKSYLQFYVKKKTTVSTVEDHWYLPNEKPALFLLLTEWSVNPFCHHTNQTPHLRKKKNGVINKGQSSGGRISFIYIVRPDFSHTNPSNFEFTFAHPLCKYEIVRMFLKPNFFKCKFILNWTFSDFYLMRLLILHWWWKKHSSSDFTPNSISSEKMKRW